MQAQDVQLRIADTALAADARRAEAAAAQARQAAAAARARQAAALRAREHAAHVAHEQHLAQLAAAAAAAKAAQASTAVAATSPGSNESSPSVGSSPASTSYTGSGVMQSCIISRESGGNSQIWNATGHWGLYQFSYDTWVAHGGPPADFGHAGVAEQNQIYYNTVAVDGYSDWAPYDGC